MLRNTPNNESIIVEYGFADSKGDDVSQIKNNWQELTEAVVRALASYIGVPYIPPTGSESNYYTVKAGDSLYGIARQYGTTVDELKRLNNLASNNLTIGMTLKIPTSQEDNTGASTYIVKAGDTLYSIASKNGMTVDELKALNNLSGNTLSIGQQLKLADNGSTNDNSYVVKAGDSLYSIAKKFNISADELKRANNKQSNLLSIGEVLVIPNNQSSNSGGTYYTVKAGDTLYSIARLYNTTVDSIKRANNLTSNSLSIGQQLKV
ncbi:MAG: LysM peptidoglycan-binding domain-containing protein [Bacilli bacterium]|nr:LysM peptidoglycan-binding domain-containing protein [Bacilli bacterium]